MYQVSANGLAAPELVFASGQTKSADDISSDGRYLLYDTGGNGKTGPSIGVSVLPLFGKRKSTVFLETHAAQARFSPSGRYIAYLSDESGNPEVYVQGFSQTTGKWQISSGGGQEPMWRADGKELFYLSHGNLMAVDVKTDSTAFEVGVPKALFAHPHLLEGPVHPRNRYVVSRDGKRFLFSTPAESQNEKFYILTNWTAAIKK